VIGGGDDVIGGWTKALNCVPLVVVVVGEPSGLVVLCAAPTVDSCC